jgi:hypothetical protein
MLNQIKIGSLYCDIRGHIAIPLSDKDNIITTYDTEYMKPYFVEIGEGILIRHYRKDFFLKFFELLNE